MYCNHIQAAVLTILINVLVSHVSGTATLRRRLVETTAAWQSHSVSFPFRKRIRKKPAPRCRGLNLPRKHRGAKQIKTQIAQQAFGAPPDPASAIFPGTNRTVRNVFRLPTSAASMGPVARDFRTWVSSLTIQAPSIHPSSPPIHPSNSVLH